MRIYSKMNAGAIDDPQYGHFEPGDHGGFDLPEELADRQLAFHHRGKPAWETQEQRDERLHGEETSRQRDPATLYGAVAELLGLAKRAGAAEAAASGDATARPAEAPAARVPAKAEAAAK